MTGPAGGRIHDVAWRGFSAGAEAYEAARPGYPAAALEALAGPVGIAAGQVVCDLGAGTGKLTRELVALGATVVAVEPVAEMRRVLGAAAPGAEVRDGTAESIPLATESVDVVTVAQAFHWFDAPAALAEVARVLRPGGRLALLWNERDERSAWVAEMSRLIGWHDRTVSRYQHVDWPGVVEGSGAFTPLVERVFAWEQFLDRRRLAERVRSISYVAAMPAPERERLVRSVVALVARRSEPFPMPYTCRVQWAVVAST